MVGKAGELDGRLPFAVLDDGAAGRAPVHGLVAGLRAAAHDTVVALPVDVPLMTPEALRALGEAQAVPSPRVPLPGGDPRLEDGEQSARIRPGELSLRGVNETTLEIPERLLVDADTPAALADLERLA